ncbi:MAG: phenylalanine--tRNA ligase subunit beta, partial [Pirellulales bacterium]
ESTEPVERLVDVQIECPELCDRYTARVVRGVRIGPSPEWMTDRLRSVGIAAINNVVDCTNYVMLESGQPLHAFDLGKLVGPTIVVRQARPGEEFLAIDHRTYELDPRMCVIADVERAIAIGGVMGGAESEVSEKTVDLLIESARFDPLTIRTAARQLNLHSPSSYRFERSVDPEGVAWASRRCVELILELAGGQAVAGMVDRGNSRNPREPIVLRFSQLKRILGIEIAPDEVRRILSALGNETVRTDLRSVEVIPPSWRGDLTREIDLVEEVARIHGYDQIPEDVGVPMAASARSKSDRVVEQVRHVLTAAGFNEAMTLSTVSAEWSQVPSPWTDAAPLVCSPAILRGSDRLRQSLIPSLLGARRANEALANDSIELFEIAHLYLPQREDFPREEAMLALTSGKPFLDMKGVLEGLLAHLAPSVRLSTTDIDHALLDPARSSQLLLDDDLLGYVGEVRQEGLDLFQLRQPTTVMEIGLASLIEAAQLIRKHVPLSPYPSVTRDRNVVFDESVRWADVERIVIRLGGPHLERVDYQETYRDPQRVGKGKKSLLFSISLRSQTGTLTREDADAVCERIDAALRDQLHGQLRM